MKKSHISFLISAGSATVILLMACQSLPSNNATLEAARADFRAAQEDPRVREFATSELQQAHDAMVEADRAWARNEDFDEIQHQAYLAQQRVAIARETALGRRAELMLNHSADARGQVVTASAASAAGQDPELDEILAQLGARATDRGSVVAFGGLLFDSRHTRLNAAGLRQVDKLVQLLNRFPLRRLRVEGYCDTERSRAMNEALSLRRAEAVRSALLKHGVIGERLDVHGYGEVAPVRSTGTVVSRHRDRRVEIVLSDAAGKLGAP